uniref:Dephospho-CoA kinase domain-containing protein n=1 Tax=Anopheles braziliensis TaxID=58242 RepID=A0A2M3ZB03_9DIPT
MFLVALTGGVASGKSTVTKIFRDNGVPVIDADAIAREVVEPGRPAWHKIKATFGESVFHEDSGELNREALGRIIFDDVEKRRQLNEITHPEIHRIIYKSVIKCFLLGHNFVVMDLPLLFETRVMLNFIHKIITVTCEEDIQVARLIDRSKYTEAEATKRIKAQMPLELKCEQSHFVIENSGTFRDTEEQTLKILAILQDSNQHWKIRGVIFATAALLVSSIAWILNYKYKWYGANC